MKIHELQNNPIVKKHILISTLGITLGVLIFYYINVNESETQRLFPLLKVILSGSCGLLVSYIIYVITLKLDKVLPWQTQLGNRLLAGIIIHFITAFFITTGLIYLYNKFILNNDSFKQASIKLAIILFLLTLIYSVIYFALYSYYSYATTQIDIVKHERKQIDLQLKALKSQLSPHFLFNNFNTISSLIFKDVKKAESYIRHLSKMYQYTLKSYNTKLTTLQEEIDTVTDYQYLLETRFGNKFTYSIDIPEKIKTSKIPPLTLQMLVENAVKHNQMDNKNPLEIKISFDGNYICVKNNITKTPQKVNSFNIGLKNINTRYLLLCKEGIVIQKDEYFTVQIPIIR